MNTLKNIEPTSSKANHVPIAPKQVNANDFWLDFKKWKFDHPAAKIAKGEVPDSGYTKTGFTIPKGCSDFFYEKLIETCKEVGVKFVEYDCRTITHYNDALGFIRRLANEDVGPKVVHISHYTEIPNVENRQTIGNLLVSSWKNEYVCVADVELDARPLLVFLSCEEGAESDFDPWDRNGDLGRYIYKKKE